MHIGTRRAFGKLSTTIAAIALGLIVTLAGFAASAAESGNEARPAQDGKLQSEFLLDLTLEAQTPQNLGSAGGGRLIVPVSGGTFAGPRLKGTIIPREATGSCSGPTDLASSTFASCCKLMMDKNLCIVARNCLCVSWWNVKRAHLAGFRNGGGEICVAE